MFLETSAAPTAASLPPSLPALKQFEPPHVGCYALKSSPTLAFMAASAFMSGGQRLSKPSPDEHFRRVNAAFVADGDFVGGVAERGRAFGEEPLDVATFLCFSPRSLQHEKATKPARL